MFFNGELKRCRSGRGREGCNELSSVEGYRSEDSSTRIVLGRPAASRTSEEAVDDVGFSSSVSRCCCFLRSVGLRAVGWQKAKTTTILSVSKGFKASLGKKTSFVSCAHISWRRVERLDRLGVVIVCCIREHAEGSVGADQGQEEAVPDETHILPSFVCCLDRAGTRSSTRGRPLL